MSNQSRIILMLFLILFTLFTVTVIYFFLRREIKYKENYTIYLLGKRNTHSIYYALYVFFREWRVTKNYIMTVSKSISIYSSGDLKDTAVKTMKLVMKVWVLDVFLLIFIFFLNPNVYTFFLSVMYVLIINRQIFYLAVEKGNLNLLKQFDTYIGEVRHNYQIHGMIDEAIFDALNQTPNPMKNHGQIVYEILNATDVQEEVVKYNEVTPNRFLKIFLSLCVMMITYGDKKSEGQSLFLTNLKYLRQEVNIEIINIERIRHIFSGLMFITLVPVLSLKIIENWAESCLPDMENYYKSIYGILTVTIIFLATYVSYVLISRLQENAEYERKSPVILGFLCNIPYIKRILTPILNKNYGKTLKLKALLLKAGEPYTCMEFLLKRILYGILGILLCSFLSYCIHCNNKEQVVNNYKDLDYLNSGISTTQVNKIQELIKIYVRDYKDLRIKSIEIEEKLKKEGSIKSVKYISLTADEIKRRIEKYQKEYYHWYELIIALLIAAIFYNIPYFHLRIVKKLRERNMEDEIIQYHSIILMLIHMDRITIEIILEWLENFAIIFKTSLEKCRNEIQNGELEILEELKQKETYHPFVKIIENLQISDRIGIEKAFDEIVMDRKNYQDKRKLDNEMNLQDKAMLGKVIAYIPFMITVGLYLIIPFIMKGLTTYLGYMEQINGGV